MFQILKADKMIDFMRWSKFAFALSLVMNCRIDFYSVYQMAQLGTGFHGRYFD